MIILDFSNFSYSRSGNRKCQFLGQTVFSVISISREQFVGFGSGKNYMKGVDLSYLHNETLIY